MNDTRDLLGKWKPKTQVILAGGNERDQQDNRAANVRLHVMHLRNALADPWNNPHEIPLQPVLMEHYADVIKVEHLLFIQDMQLTLDQQASYPDENGRRFWSGTVQQLWEGWLCARLGFLPERII